MPDFIDVEKMLCRKEPVTREEWAKILECVTEMLRPILKNTTLPKLYDIELNHPLSFTRNERFFTDEEEAARVTSRNIACECERGLMTEGIFFFADKDVWETAGNKTVAFILGLTRNGKWVKGETSWVTFQRLYGESNFTRYVSFFWIKPTSPTEIINSTYFQSADVIDILRGVLGNITMRKRMQLTDLENVESQMSQIILTTRRIPKNIPRT